MSENDEAMSMRTRITVWLAHRYYRLARGMTLGVRAACFDAEGRVFLVRHSYVPGWSLPGGGVERNETALDALGKELREEGNLVMTSPPDLIGVYLNRHASPRDHVLFYRVEVRQTSVRAPDMEIRESGFFHPSDLPPNTTAATLRRLAELDCGGPCAPLW